MSGSGFVPTAAEFAHPSNPIQKALNAMNHTLQSILQAHYFDPRNGLTLKELSRGGDQLGGVVVRRWRCPNVQGPIATIIPRCTPYLIFQ